MSGVIRISRIIVAEILAHVREEPEHETCGLLAGSDGVITAIFPATNAASQAATSYEIAPEELFRLMRELRATGLELLGIYHSHPTSENTPSASDVERAYYPEAAYFIISPSERDARPVRAFSIRDGGKRELEIKIL